MADEPKETATSWKQWRVKTNLGTLASVAIAISVLVWQGMLIRSQIDDNSNAVTEMAVAVDGLAGAVSLANELDTRTNQMFSEIENLRTQYQDQAYAWAEISTNTERVDQVRMDLDNLGWQLDDLLLRAGEFVAVGQTVSDLEWKVSEVERRLAEMIGGENADVDLTWQVSDLVRQVGEIQGRLNSGGDLDWEVSELERRVDDIQAWRNNLGDFDWELENLENGLDWEIDELNRQLTELRVRIDTGGSGIEQWQIDDLWNAHNDVYGRTEDLYGRSDEMWDLLWRMWYALETQDWSHEHLYR